MTPADGSGVITFHDEGLARRLKALACTAPLHDLDARKVRLDWCDGAGYQMAEIALQAIDQVTVAMDFDRGADHEDVVNRVLPFVAAQAPEQGCAEHARVARWVLDNLINVGSTDRGSARCTARSGHRGRTSGGCGTSASSSSLSLQTGRSTCGLLTRRSTCWSARWTRMWSRPRDVRAVDWEREVPDLIDEALTHIAERYRYENAILTNITQTRDEAEDPVHKRKAAELVEIVSDCIRRHTQLQARLQDAGGTFRAEQDRQQFSGHAQRAVVDLFGHLLMPTLALPVSQATAPVAAFFGAVSGLTPPRLPRLVHLVEQLLTPPQEGSVFEQKFDDYARRVVLGERRDLERVLHGIAHLAIAALAFPRPDDLAADTYVGRVSVERADSVVREACTMLAAKAAAAEEAGDPLEEAPELERAWRVYLRRPEAAPTKDGRLAPSTTRGVIAKALRFLADQGFLARVNDEYGGTYRTMPRYQVQVRELAAERAFAELLDLGVVAVTDPSGSLRAVPSPGGGSPARV